MTRKGCDYAWGRPSVASLQAAGVTFACRYLSYGPAVGGKNLEPGEAARLQSAGIDVVSNWEWYGDWAHDYSGGYITGRAHAIEADRQHRALGGSADRPIYFSTDFNPSTDQLPTIADYYRGVASAIGLQRTGAYGGYRTISYLFDAGVIAWGWQTYAWSTQRDPDGVLYVRFDPRAQLQQTKNGVLIGGVDCDIDYATVDDFGQWTGDDMTPEEHQWLEAVYDDLFNGGGSGTLGARGVIDTVYRGSNDKVGNAATSQRVYTVEQLRTLAVDVTAIRGDVSEIKTTPAARVSLSVEDVAAIVAGLVQAIHVPTLQEIEDAAYRGANRAEDS